MKKKQRKKKNNIKGVLKVEIKNSFYCFFKIISIILLREINSKNKNNSIKKDNAKKMKSFEF